MTDPEVIAASGSNRHRVLRRGDAAKKLDVGLKSYGREQHCARALIIATKACASRALRHREFYPMFPSTTVCLPGI